MDENLEAALREATLSEMLLVTPSEAPMNQLDLSPAYSPWRRYARLVTHDPLQLLT
jgi:hypothetical protein